MRGREFFALLAAHGWEKVRDSGTHQMFEHSETKQRVPMGAHPSRQIPRGLLKTLYERFGIWEEDMPVRGGGLTNKSAGSAGRRVMKRKAPLPPLGSLRRLLVESREAAGWNQIQLASELNITPSMISLWESGASPIPVRRAKQMIEVFGWTEEQLRSLRGYGAEFVAPTAEEEPEPVAPAPEPTLTHDQALADAEARANEAIAEAERRAEGKQPDSPLEARLRQEEAERRETARRRQAATEQERIERQRARTEPARRAIAEVRARKRAEKGGENNLVKRQTWHTDPYAVPSMSVDDSLEGDERLFHTRDRVAGWLSGMAAQNSALRQENLRLQGLLDNANSSANVAVQELQTLRSKAKKYDNMVRRLLSETDEEAE